MKKPEINPNAEKIDKIINRIDSGDIRIPAFQRAYVWKQSQILDLLDSVFNNYPIGSVLLWNSSERLKHTRNIAGYKIPDSEPEYPINYVLDGQQRLSSIYAVFSDKTEQEKTSEKYNPDLDIFEIYYDFKQNIFLPKNETETESNHVIYLRNFLDGAKLITALQSLNPSYHEQAKELYSKFINYELPVVTIKNRQKQEVGIIFERINNTATKLTTLDLMTAWTWTDDFHLLEEISRLLEELEEKGFGGISQNILLQTLSSIIQNDTTTQAILQLSGETVRDNWSSFCESLKKSIDFLATELNCVNSDFLPYPQQLIAISKFYSLNGQKNAENVMHLKKWFWKTSFSNRYSTGQTTTKMNSDIKNMQSLIAGDTSVMDGYAYTVTDDELITIKFSKRNPTTRAFLLFMAQFSPKDLIKNTAIDLDRALSEYNRKEYHHIFPNAFLKKQGHSSDKIFSLVNFCFLPSESNKQISRKAPSDYFFNLIPQNKFSDILESNLIPIKKDIYQRNDFIEFLKKRAELAINKLDVFTT